MRRRAAIHAALGDPARLQIADILLLGDVSPSELADRLGMPSNLLAHHLNVLEQAGVISRRRSEGDRRRTYLRWTGDTANAPDLVAATPERVLFVCTANSARSHLAAALWRQVSTIPSASAGTHPAPRIDPGALEVARRHELPLARRRPRHLDEVLTDLDLVVSVCDRAHEELGRVSQLHWSIADPALVGTAPAFDRAYVEIADRVAHLSRQMPTAS